MQKTQCPLTSKDIDRIDELTDEQVLLEAKYLKKTISPNLRLKYKEGKKFINFTIDEIKRQIRDVIQPSSLDDGALHLEKLLEKVYPAFEPDIAMGDNDDESAKMDTSENNSGIAVGTLGFWKGPLDESKMGVLLEPETLQTYKKSGFGMVPDGLPKDANQWKLETVIYDFGLEQRGDKLYLVF